MYVRSWLFSIIGAIFVSLTAQSQTVHFVVDAGMPTGFVRPLLGVNAGPHATGEPGNPHLLDEYTDVGVTMVRTHDYYGPLDMRLMYPDNEADPDDPSSYDFSLSDEYIEMIHDNGHAIYFRLGNSYDHGGEPPSNLPHFIEASKNVIRHYTEGLWDGYELPIEYIEVWNEPENSHFWTGSRIQFLQFFSALVKSLKAEFPDIKIGGPGFLPTGFYIQEFPPVFLAHCRDNDVPLDFVSWHLYSNNPQDFFEAGAYYRSVLDEYGFEEAESHISEWNTNNDSLRFDAKSAAQMTGAWIALQNQPVDVSTFYRGTDTSLGLPTFFGMFYADGSYKKIAYAFRAWSWMADHRNRVYAKSNDETVMIIAAQPDDDSIALLLTRYDDESGEASEPKTYEISISGAGFDDPLLLQRYALNDDLDMERIQTLRFSNASELGVREFLIPRDQVEYITIQPAPSAVDDWRMN